MAFNSNITPGNPPLLWSNMESALRQINENFDSLVATIGDGSGLTPIDFNTLDTNVSPASNGTYGLGNSTNKWRNVYTSEWSNVGADQLNGVWLGSAQIKGIGSSVELPAGSTVNGSLIIDPDKTFFKSAQIDDGDRIEANEFSDTLNFLSGDGIVLTVGSPGESITITNDGIIAINGIDGISATTVAGVTTISNAGVRSLQNTGSLPAGRTVGAGIYIDNAVGPGIKITNTGILGFDNSGFGTVISVDAATGLATVGLSPGVVTTAAFRTISVTGQSNVEADGPSDTLTVTPGYGILMTTDPGTDTITVSVNPELDIKGSIVGNDSSVIVDAEDRKVYADLIGNVTGNVTGNLSGNVTGTLSGNVTGNVSGSAGSAGVANTLDITNTNGLTTVYYPTFVENRTTGQTVRADADLTYRTDTNTLTVGIIAATTIVSGSLSITGGVIGTTDSSSITINELTTFNTDVNFENDITVAERLTVKGSRVINLNELKSIVADSTDFNNFKARIAALV